MGHLMGFVSNWEFWLLRESSGFTLPLLLSLTRICPSPFPVAHNPGNTDKVDLSLAVPLSRPLLLGFLPHFPFNVVSGSLSSYSFGQKVGGFICAFLIVCSTIHVSFLHVSAKTALTLDCSLAKTWKASPSFMPSQLLSIYCFCPMLGFWSFISIT